MGKHLKFYWIIAAIPIFSLLVFAFTRYEIIMVGNKEIRIEKACRDHDRIKGLSKRNSLCSDCGMLFLFEEKGVYPFWMKEMKFGLDMIWINGNRIVGIERKVSHEKGESEIAFPQIPIDKVLEINYGKSDEWGIREGDIIMNLDDKICRIFWL